MKTAHAWLLVLTSFLLAASAPSCQAHAPTRPPSELCNTGFEALFCNDPRLPEGQQDYRIPLGTLDAVNYQCKTFDSWAADEAYIEELIRIIEERENCQRQ
jgi:hypothetical protein